MQDTDVPYAENDLVEETITIPLSTIIKPLKEEGNDEDAAATTATAD